jgi:anti-sigma regulatory factor (Ser/Thr protein kinase)
MSSAADGAGTGAPGPAGDPGTAPPADGGLLTRSFDAAAVRDLRHAVARCAARAGLAGSALDDFVLAVNELMTNAVRHGGGLGRLRLWIADGGLVCEVTDEGGGITDAWVDGRRRPAPHVPGGWGLWLARELSRTMTVVTGESGTAVRIIVPIPPSGADPVSD